MKRLHIDFAEHVEATQGRTGRMGREWRTLRHAHPLVRLAAAAALTLCVAAAVAGVELSGRYRAATAELHSLARQTNAPPAPLKAAAQDATEALTPAQRAAVNGAIGRLNLPWRALLDAVEAATPPQIALLALEPDAHRQIVRGLAEARDSDAMFAYLSALRAQPIFSGVQISRHDTDTQNPNRPVRFQFEARWGQGLAQSQDASEDAPEAAPRDVPAPGPATAHPAENKQ